MIMRLLTICLLALPAGGILADNAALLQRTPQTIEGARPGTVGEREFRRLSRAQQLMAEEKYDEAIDLLRPLEESARRAPYTRAQVYQTMGYVYAQSDRFDEAIKSFNLCLELEALPLQPTLATMYSLAQVYVAKEDYLKAIPILQDYLHNIEAPNPDAQFFYGQLLAQVDLRQEAARQVERAIQISDTPRENWFRLLTAIYYEEKEYGKAAASLVELININPDRKEYWIQLSSIYVSADKEKEALASLELAQKRGFLDEERDILQLVRLSLFQGIPYKAGVYLKEAIDAGIVEKTQGNIELLADSWIRAQEVDRALEALAEAAPLAKDGSVFVRRGQLLLEKEDWQGAVRAIRDGIAKGGLDRPGLAYVALGIAQYRLGQVEASLNSFREASKHPQQQRQANEWINHLRSNSVATH